MKLVASGEPALPSKPLGWRASAGRWVRFPCFAEGLAEGVGSGAVNAGQPYTRRTPEVGPLERRLNRTRAFRLALIGLLAAPLPPPAAAAPLESIKLDLLAGLSPAELAALAARFWSKVERVVDGCWRWTAALNDDGYGVFGLGKRDGKKLNAYAHRLAWELERGPIPAGLTIDHTRDCKCVNPAHMEPVTNTENTRRRTERRRGQNPARRAAPTVSQAPDQPVSPSGSGALALTGPDCTNRLHHENLTTFRPPRELNGRALISSPARAA